MLHRFGLGLEGVGVEGGAPLVDIVPVEGDVGCGVWDLGRDPSAPLVDVVPHREEDVEQQVEEHLRRGQEGQTRQAPEV